MLLGRTGTKSEIKQDWNLISLTLDPLSHYNSYAGCYTVLQGICCNHPVSQRITDLDRDGRNLRGHQVQCPDCTDEETEPEKRLSDLFRVT